MSEKQAGKSSARRKALDMLLAVERGGYANLVLKEALSDKMDEQERAFAAALFYTALDHQLYLDFIIDSYAKGRLQLPVRCVLRLGVCQLLYMNVPESAAVNESVELVKSLGKGALSGFVNGTLRAVARAKDNLPQPKGSAAQVLSITHSWPLWIVAEWIARFGEQTAREMVAYSAEPALTVRENPFRAAKGEVEEVLRARGISFERGAFAAEALRLRTSFDVQADPLFTSGKMAVQGESSVLVCKIADPKPGGRVLDACAAPGGKSLCMAALMGAGVIDAWDVHNHRVELIQKNCVRMNVGFVHPSLQDASVHQSERDELYDVVLIDAPCSGLGVVGGKPDIKYAKSADDLASLAKTQRAILSACAPAVKKGGALVYSTCTISRAENEDNIDWFLREYGEFAPCDLTPYLPAGFDAARAAGGRVQLLPHLDGVDGFFVCRMVRR